MQIQEHSGNVKEPVKQSNSSAEPAAIKRPHRRGILESLLARSALLLLIYAVINVVYQQSYLSYLGFCVGLWPVATALPLMTDVLVAFYAFMTFIFLTRMPDRWFDTAAELFNLATWWDWETWLSRGLSLLFPYFVFAGLNSVSLYLQRATAPSLREVLFPTYRLFGQTRTAIVFGILCLAFLAGVWRYRRICSLHIRQATRRHRKQVRGLLNGVFPGGFLTVLATIALIFPSWYGLQRAETDLGRLAREGLQVALAPVFDGEPLCGVHQPLPEGVAGAASVQMPKRRMHFLGRMQDQYLFLVLEGQSRDGSLVHGKPDFSVCLVNTRSLRGLELWQQ